MPIHHGDPTIDLDPNFLNHTELHVLNPTGPNLTVTPINVNQTYGREPAP